MTRSTPSRFKLASVRLTRAVVALTCVLILLSPLLAQFGRAEEAGKTITLGESLNDVQRAELLTYFEAGEDDRIIVITTADTIEAMAGISMVGTIYSAYSSTALECRDLGEGLDVTTRNITQVTPDLYAIALVTAGIGDARLVVAAPNDARAAGMTALAGIFKTWDLAPCSSGDTNNERQQLALEELALATAIGQILENAGIADGVQRAGNVVLETQKTIVTEKLTDSADIDAAIATQELAQGIAIPIDLRVQLVDLMTRLAAQDIDWSTFSAGWTIERSPDNTRVTMTGDGIAIRNARATATAQAKAEMTATAQAADNMTATAEAAWRNETATAQAALDMTATAEAEATQQAEANLTATALAQPTPLPTATPAPFTVSGKIVAKQPHEIVVELSDGSGLRRPFRLAANVTVERNGTSSDVGSLDAGDTVLLTLDGSTREVIHIAADPPQGSFAAQVGRLTVFLLTGTVLTAVIWARRRREEPFIVTVAQPDTLRLTDSSRQEFDASQQQDVV